ncbi:MAG: acyltransferase, partial [Muribaculaceae bacterium]|nr:acyltransferase [Muribaculaceae bacterium]
KHKSVWIAHLEGRSKDSNDRTQERLIKMLGLEGDGATFTDRIRGINLMPVAISYEFDPNDYLKVREFLLRRRDPEFKKSQRDDLFSMETGILRNKGRVHFAVTECLNPAIDAAIAPDADRAEAIATICAMIDNAIHSHYRLFPINYVAYDELSGENRFSDQYSPEEKQAVDDYISGQLVKVDVENITDEEVGFMRSMMLTMYANPLKNKLKL